MPSQSFVAEMSTGIFRDFLIVEFSGRAPDVPFMAGVDYNALTMGDDKPVFVTLPVGLVNAKSANKRFYDERFVVELEKQIYSNKPIGLMGHLRKDQEATDFPAEAVHWVGARREGDILWAKGYLPVGESRNRLLRYEATGKKIATSIYAEADGTWDSEKGAFSMLAETLNLRQIDIAPADRAGIAGLAAVPYITAEMSDEIQEPKVPIQEEIEMDKDQVIRELTAEDASSLPEVVRLKIAEEAKSKFESTLREILGVEETVDIAKTVRELRQATMDQEQREITSKIRELSQDPAVGIKLESARDLVVELVANRHPSSVTEAERVYGEVIGSESVKKVLASIVQETMGPPQRVPIAGQKDQDTNGKFFVIPKEDQRK